MDNIAYLRIILREKDIPFFEDEELDFYLQKNNRNINDTVYECALLKAENSSLSVGGLTLADDSGYFKRLAAQYAPNHSGILKGGY